MFCPTCPGLEAITSWTVSYQWMVRHTASRHSALDVPPEKEIQQNDIWQMLGPRHWSATPNSTIQKSFCEGFSNVQTPVWGSPNLLARYVWLQNCYLGEHKLFQNVKVNASCYCVFHEEKWPP